MPSRMRLVCPIDSKVIDMAGAEELLGYGDMLSTRRRVKARARSGLLRFGKRVESVVDYKEPKGSSYDEEIMDEINAAPWQKEHSQRSSSEVGALNRRKLQRP